MTGRSKKTKKLKTAMGKEKTVKNHFRNRNKSFYKSLINDD